MPYCLNVRTFDKGCVGFKDWLVFSCVLGLEIKSPYNWSATGSFLDAQKDLENRGIMIKMTIALSFSVDIEDTYNNGAGLLYSSSLLKKHPTETQE